MVNEQIVGFEILTQIIVTQDQLCMKTSNYAWKTVRESVRETKEVTNERKSCEEDSHVSIELKVRASPWCHSARRWITSAGGP